MHKGLSAPAYRRAFWVVAVLLAFGAGSVNAETAVDESTTFTHYYVNDGATTNDVYCSAIGDAANDGLSAATPKADIQSILDAYDLEAGDTIYVDTGRYELNANITINAVDGGTSSNPVTIMGTFDPEGSVIDRNYTGSSSSRAFDVNTGGVTLMSLDITGAYYGVDIAGGTVELADIDAHGNRVGIKSTSELILRWSDVTDNLSNGLNCSGPATITRNNITDNGGKGIDVYYGGEAFVLENNVIARNNSYGLYAYLWDGPASVTVRNNTICDNARTQVQIGFGYGSGYTYDLRNNILRAGGGYWACLNIEASFGTLDYNLYHTTEGSPIGWINDNRYYTLADWQSYTGRDAHSMQTDPRFMESSYGMYYQLASAGGRWDFGPFVEDDITSPAIDAGVPSFSVGNETEPNGGRINLGAYGGTDWASRTPTSRVLALLTPYSGQVWPLANQQVTWRRLGTAWTGSETLTIELSRDDGATWTTLSTNAWAANQSYNWTANAPTTPAARIRVTCNQDTQVIAASDMFQIGDHVSYYVNDASTAGDVYTTAVGDAANNGLFPSAPKHSVQDILDTYDLGPGDVIYVDTGEYTLSAEIHVPIEDQGDSERPLRIVGATTERSTVIDRNSSLSSATGIRVEGSYVHLEHLTVTGAGGDGIMVDSSLNGDAAHVLISQCVLQGNGVGIYAHWGPPSLTVAHCLFVDNTDSAIYAYSLGHDGVVTAQNNTIVGSGHGFAIDLRNTFSSVNNIFDITGTGSYCYYFVEDDGNMGTSDYNCFHVRDGAAVAVRNYTVYENLAQWNRIIGKDDHSLQADPRFTDPANGNYHLASTAGSLHDGTFTADSVTSLAIDAGNPASDYADETASNGGRINLGAYGNTADASRTPAERILRPIDPRLGTVWTSTEATIRWDLLGTAWADTETLRIEHSEDDGQSWTVVAEGVTCSAGTYAWNLETLPAGVHYRLRLTCLEYPAVQCVTDRFRIGAPIDFYVNDASATGDEYTIAPGSDAADGTTPATPMASIQRVLDTYDLEPGDVVWVDRGTYVLDASVSITRNDQGTAADAVRIVGSATPDGTVLDHDAHYPDVDVINVIASYVSIENLTLTGAQGGAGVCLNDGRLQGWAHAVTMQRCRFHSNEYGVMLHWGPDNARIANCLFAGNSEAGIIGYSLGTSGNGLAINCVFDGEVHAIEPQTRTTIDSVNNIFVARGSDSICYVQEDGVIGQSDYNDFHLTDGAVLATVNYVPYATLADWQGYNGSDSQSLDADPLFLDAEAGDYHLWDGSPCIDAGTNADAPAVDIDGDDRPFNLQADIGLDEFTFPTGPADFGDAPDPSYPTLRASNGAYHLIAGGLTLGPQVDADADGQPSGDALGDDQDGQDDDNGVFLFNPFHAGRDTRVLVMASAPGRLDAWIDFNRDGDWTDPDEQVIADTPVPAGACNLTVPVPESATLTDQTFARFRLSSQGGLGPAGGALDGEVEDYAVAVGLAPPVLEPEPPLTPGPSNTVEWTPVPQATDYLVEVDEDPTFASPDADSGWITGTSAEFADLLAGQPYHYRCQARNTTVGVPNQWSQTNASQFEENTLTDTQTTETESVALAPTFSPPTVDEVGSTDYDMSGSRYTRVNVILVEEDVVLTAFEISYKCYGSYDFDFVVYEGTDNFYSTYTLVHQNTVAGPVSTSPSFLSSGSVHVPLHAGKHYAIGVCCESNIYRYYGIGNNAVSFGTSKGYEFDYGYPAPQSFSFPSSSTVALQMRYTTVAGTGYATSGDMVTPLIAPTPFSGWTELSYDAVVPSGTNLTVDILGADGVTPIPGFTQLSNGADLTALTASEIHLRANLSTADAAVTPELTSWSASYQETPDIHVLSDWSAVETSQQCIVVAADFDGDCDVDGDDLATLASCASGPAIPHDGSPSCEQADLDSDADVDQLDLGLFQRCISGSGQPALPDCLE